MIRELGYIGINSRDLAAWSELLTEVLGLQLAERQEETALFRMDKYSWRIAIHRSDAEDVAYLGWMVGSRDELEDLQGRLDGGGVTWRRGTQQEAEARKVRELVVFHDPFGIRQEAFYAPLIDPRPFSPSRGISGFVTEGQGFGHAVIGVSNEQEREAALRFYCDLLGLRLTDFIDFQVAGHMFHGVFLHCNPRHHSLAIVQIPYSVEKRLRHFMVQVSSIDDVGYVYDDCLSRGIVTRTIGRHPNDRMFSFYLRSPSGFEIEYGAGAITIEDERQWVVQCYPIASSWGHHRLESQPDLQKLASVAKGT